MELEPTQRLDSSTEEEDSFSENQENIRGFLTCISPEEHEGKEFSLLPGDNIIGRDPAKCRIALQNPVSYFDTC